MQRSLFGLHLGLRGRIFGGFGAVVGLVALLGGNSILSSGTALTGITAFRDALDGASAIIALNNQALTLRVAVGAWFANASAENQKAVDHEFAALKALDAAQSRTASTPVTRQLFSDLDTAITRYQTLWLDHLGLNGAFDQQYQITVSKGQDLQQEIQSIQQDIPEDHGAEIAKISTISNHLAGAMTWVTQLRANNVDMVVVSNGVHGLTTTANMLAALRKSGGEQFDHAADMLKDFPAEYQHDADLAKGLIKHRQDLEAGSRAVSAITEQIKAAKEAEAQTAESLLVRIISGIAQNSAYGAGLIVLIAAGMAWWSVRTVTRPIMGMTRAMQALAEGDTATPIPSLQRRDELGKMAKTLEVFRNNAIEVARLQQEQLASVHRAAAERRAALAETASRFEATVSTIVHAVSNAVQKFQGGSAELQSLADETNQRTAIVAAAAEEASVNVRAVAGATEELSQSSASVAQEIKRSSRITEEIATRSRTTNATMEKLNESAGQIGTIVELIRGIAARTNMLALNATIEAARAGESGRGFAVVAQEVKLLASQTAKATVEISSRIATIQTATEAAVTDSRAITQIMGELHEIGQSIATASEKQQAVMESISHNAQQMAVGVQEVTGNISGVNEAAGVTGRSAADFRDAATLLGRQSVELSSAIDGFVEMLRAG